MLRKSIQFASAFSFFILLCVSLVPGLKGTEEQLRISLPEVVITSPDESKLTDVREIFVAHDVAQGVKAEPEIESKALDVEMTAHLQKVQPATKSPGCAYSSSLSTKVAKVFEGEIALYKQGIYRYVRHNYADAVESFDKLIINYPESSLKGSAYYWLGESKLHLDQLENSLECFLEIINQHPAH
jgi:TolA-binding protein